MQGQLDSSAQHAPVAEGRRAYGDASTCFGDDANSANVIRAALEHISQGVSVVDANLQVIAYNNRFFELLDLPQEWFGQQLRFEDVIRFIASRGEYGEGDTEELVAQCLAQTQHLGTQRSERTRPNGIVIEVARTTLPGGGFVTTYTDITARDAAVRSAQESEARARMIIESVHDAVIAMDEDGRITGWNRRASTLFGWMRHEALGQRFDELALSLSSQPTYRHALGRCALDADGVHAGQPVELSARRRDSSELPVELSLASTRLNDHLIHSAFVRDISSRKCAEEALRASEARFRTIIESEPECVKMLARDGTLIDMNPAGLRMIEAESIEPVRGACVYSLISPTDRQAFVAMNARVFEGHEETLQFELIGLKGKRRLMQTTAAPLRDANGDVIAQLAITRDVTEAHRLAEKVKYQATHDMLTALPNRHEFEHRLEAAIASARLEGANHVLCFIDLDQFKVINDTCGHIAGDALLRQLGDTLRKSVRGTDLLARLGGDEFALLMEECSIDTGMRAIESLRQRIEEFRFSWQRTSFSIAASIGVVPIGPASESAAAVMSAADAACYAAKDAGRNRVHLYDQGGVETDRRHGEMQWVARLQDALDEDRFELHTQIIVPISPDTEVTAHHEVLLRMRNADGTLVMPGAFLPAAERYNLAARLDRWVINRVLECMCGTNGQALSGHFTINLSGQTLSDEGALAFIHQRLGTQPDIARRLCFEITETAAITDMPGAMRLIEGLRGLGCSTALDDFGSGLSSFAYLRNIPVDYLKIDGLFVKDIVSDPIDRAMVRSINEVGQLMGKKTVAEFVENNEILAILREIGVDYAQGYGIGRPSPLVI